MNNDNPTYQSHDIEWFLTHKDFNDLTEGERNFVLNQVSSAEEYAELRHTLMNIQASFEAEEMLEPELSVKESLFAEFDRLHASSKTSKERSTFWNTLFPKDRSIFFSPGFQLASLAVLIIGLSFLFVQKKTEGDQVAIHEKRIEEPTTPVERETAKPLEQPISGNNEDLPSIVTNTEGDNDLPTKENLKTEEAPSAVIDNLAANDITASGSASRAKAVTLSDSTTFRKDMPGKSEVFAGTTTSNTYSGDLALEEVSTTAKNSKAGDSKRKSTSEKKKAESSSSIAESEAMLEDRVKSDKYTGVGSPVSVHPEMLELLFTAL